MGNHPATRSREYRNGWLGRKKQYICRECQTKFEVDTLNPLPEIDRVCDDCRRRTHIYAFTNTKTGKDMSVRASSAELATLRAWNISPNLTFKIARA